MSILVKNIIIIPGLGDDHPAYHLGASLFRRYGYRAHISIVGWDASPSSYTERKGKVLSLIDSLSGDIYILGVSAGGPVALAVFADRKSRVAKVATLCSPYTYLDDHQGELLGSALSELAPSLARLSDRFSDIRSYHGIYDGVVQTRLSRYEGIQDVTIPFVKHALTIFLGLTLYVPSITRFFRKP
jgi:pimeloyl-ACP methyl ester carboxylesterase